MAAAAAWLRQAIEVEDGCGPAHQMLARAAAFLEQPMLVADAQDARRRIRDALLTVNCALFFFRRASNVTRVAEILVLSSGSVNDPAIPLLSIEPLVRGLFQRARFHAVVARGFAARGVDHLHSMNHMLNIAQHFVVTDAVLEARRVLATTNLKAALAALRPSAALVVVAKWLLAR